MGTAPEFFNTAEALQTLASNSRYIFGSHAMRRVKPGGDENVLYEIDFDETRHEPEMINDLSLDDEDEDRVSITIPKRQMLANIILHQPDSVKADQDTNYGENRR